MFIPKFINNCVVSQTVVRIDRNLTVSMKAESTVARAQVFAGKRVPTTGLQYCKQKPKTKNQTEAKAILPGCVRAEKPCRDAALTAEVADINPTVHTHSLTV